VLKKFKRKTKEEFEGKVAVFPSEEYPHIMLDGIYIGARNNLREILKKYEGKTVKVSIKIIKE